MSSRWATLDWDVDSLKNEPVRHVSEVNEIGRLNLGSLIQPAVESEAEDPDRWIDPKLAGPGARLVDVNVLRWDNLPQEGAVVDASRQL